MTHPLIQRLHDEFDVPAVDLDGVEAFLRGPGVAVLFFPGDVARHKDSTDVAVVLPELVAAFPGRLRPAVVTDPETDVALFDRYKFRKWPCLLFLADGEPLGAIEGMQDWGDYLREVARMIEGGAAARPTE
jgi:hydrogenase-1 operon protein HyaE